MPRTAAANDALRIATREKLLEAAQRCFSRHGFAGTSVRTIAAEAGVAIGLVYAHFDSKDTLLLTVFAQGMLQVQDTFAAALQPVPQNAPTDSPIAVLVRAAVGTVRDHLEFWQLTYALRHQPEVLSVLGPRLGAWQSEIVETLAQIVAADRAAAPIATSTSDDRATALALFAHIDGVCQHYAADPEHYPIDAVTDALLRQWKAGGHTT
ncbi:MAG: TetR/AcrR family transcriptional regulator [Gemmatimonadaceae bacterium]|nr:TetR/AcrR family transcriptional regulator [Gemmatimonadaceae bacterium]